MLLPSMIKKVLPNAIIGFFLHIPFPSSEIFRTIYVRQEILKGLLLGCDLIGFQTYSYLRHFLLTCTRLLACESSPKGIKLENNFVKTGIYPIGINIKSLQEKKKRMINKTYSFSFLDQFT